MNEVGRESVVIRDERSSYVVHCSCPLIDVTGFDTPPGVHDFVIGWGPDCVIHGYNGVRPTYRRRILGAGLPADGHPVPDTEESA